MAIRTLTSLTLGAALLLTACGEPARSPAQPAPAPAPAISDPTAPPEPAPAPAATIKPGQGLPPASSPKRFIGRWAAAETACGHAAWDFTATDINTAGEVSCKIDKVTRTATSGYDLDVTCTAEAPPEKSVLHLTFAESAKAMMVEGGPFSGSVGLIYCGPPGGR
jgi:hypothetical protein